MDDDTTFDERVNNIRRQRRVGFEEPAVGGAGVGDFQDLRAGVNGNYTPDFSTTTGCDCESEVKALRRDVSRLEGKVDALLAALEVEDGDQ